MKDWGGIFCLRGRLSPVVPLLALTGHRSEAPVIHQTLFLGSFSHHTIMNLGDPAAGLRSQKKLLCPRPLLCPVQHPNRTQNPIRQFQGDSNLVSERSRAGFHPKTVLSRYATEKNCLSWVGNYMQMLSLTLLKYLPVSVCAAGCIRGVLIAAVSWGGAYRPA